MYRSKVEKIEVIDLILEEHVKLIKEIDLEIERKEINQKIIDNKLHAKLKKETGDVNYYSWRKNKQLEFRIDKAKERVKTKDGISIGMASTNNNTIYKK